MDDIYEKFVMNKVLSCCNVTAINGSTHNSTDINVGCIFKGVPLESVGVNGPRPLNIILIVGFNTCAIPRPIRLLFL